MANLTETASAGEWNRYSPRKMCATCVGFVKTDLGKSC